MSDEGRILDAKLTSNGYDLDLSPQRLGWLILQTRLSHSILRERYQQQDYLWLKGILPRQKVLDFRRRFLNRLWKPGWFIRILTPRRGHLFWRRRGPGSDQPLLDDLCAFGSL
jgi:hypothetical protein